MIFSYAEAERSVSAYEALQSPHGIGSEREVFVSLPADTAADPAQQPGSLFLFLWRADRADPHQPSLFAA